MHSEAHVPLPPPIAAPQTTTNADGLRMLFTAATLSQSYVIKEKLGEGTYGEVYRGVTKVTTSVGARGTPVALKRIKSLPQLFGFPVTSVREVIALRHLKSALSPAQQRHLVLLRECILSDDRDSVFLVFDYVPHSLAGLCMRRLTLDEQDLSVIFLQILRGLNILHQADVMHRDLKLDNVLVDTTGRVMLCDFGMSLPTGSDRRHLTPRLIHLLYRPPEMCLGSRVYTKSVDVWSVGCMLAQMLLHEPPFLVRDSARQGSDLAQLECMTRILGSLTQLPPDVEARESFKHEFPNRILETTYCVVRPRVSGTGRHPIAHPERRFSEWLRLQCPKGSRQPLSSVSQPLCDVLDAMLVLEPSRRLSVDALLQMPFFDRTANVEAHATQRLQRKLLDVVPSHVLSVKHEMEMRRRAHQQ